VSVSSGAPGAVGAPTVRVAEADGVLVVRLDRPQARNALQDADYVALHRAFNRAAACEQVAAVLVCGAGGHFCGGHDLTQPGLADADRLASLPFHAFAESLARCPVPIIAAVEGVAVGVGLTMLLHMDFVVAARDARFRAPFVTLGAPAEAASSLLMPTVLGPRTAARLLLLAEWLSASDPDARPLITHLVEHGEAEARARELAASVAAMPRDAVRATKRLLVAAREPGVQTAFARERAELLAIAARLEGGTAGAAFATGAVTR
jgi:enoyl-CoA hydratase/carnithine racemase